MKSRGFTLIQLLIVVASLAMLTVAVAPLFTRARESNCYPTCQSNLKQLGLGFLQYSQDYDDRMPPVATGSTTYGWTDVVFPYVKARQIYLCPQVTTPRAPAPTQFTPSDYWYNGKLSAQLLKNITAPARTILGGDGNDGKDVADGRYTRRFLPIVWLNDPGSPAHRHQDKMNLLFSDGHAKMVDPQMVVPFSTGGPTFKLR